MSPESNNLKDVLLPELKVLTWHVHGSYLYYLSQCRCKFFLPVKPGRLEGYGGKGGSYPWGDNVYEVNAREVKNLELDLVLFQSRQNYETDQYEILSAKQRRLPGVYLEHDPPRQHPTDTRHFLKDPQVLLVHVTAFNRLMWDNGEVPTVVINHGVKLRNKVPYVGTKQRGVVVINNLAKRGRRLGLDIFEKVRQEVPLDLVGIDSEKLGGLGEIQHQKLTEFLSQYRFLFNPIRYTSLGLSVCEAMAVGLPVVALATTEMPAVVENGVTGFIHTDLDRLIEKMKLLLNDRALAFRLGQNAADYARRMFSIDRFTQNWEELFVLSANRSSLKRRVAASKSRAIPEGGLL